MRDILPLVFVLLLNLAAVPAWAQRNKAPSADDIVAAARRVELDRSADVKFDASAARDLAPSAAKLTYTPIKPPAKFNEKMLADGLVVGELRASGLSPVMNNLMTIFVCKVGKKFEAFIVKNDKLTQVNSTTTLTAVSGKADKTKSPAKLRIIDGKAASQRFLRIEHQMGQLRVEMTFIVP